MQAQEKKMEAPKPGPEVKKLGYFVGSWTTTGEVKQNPFMPAGKMTSTSKCEWFPGGFHVVCHENGKSPMGGAMHGLGVMGYNAEEKVYTYAGLLHLQIRDLGRRQQLDDDHGGEDDEGREEGRRPRRKEKLTSAARQRRLRYRIASIGERREARMAG
jgi:hypothetical protein